MANTKTSLESAFKYTVDKLNDLRPNSTIVQDLAGPLTEATKISRGYRQPVALVHPMGFTFGDGSAFAYNDDNAGVFDEIEIDPNPVVLKERISLEAADRMANDKNSMLSNAALRLGSMKNSLHKVAEVSSLYGRQGFEISAVSAVNTSPTPDEITLTFSTNWAPGVWAGWAKSDGGVALDIYNGASQINSNAVCNLVAVSFDNKTITISGNNTDLSAISAGHKVFLRGSKSSDQYGIHYQLDNASTLFGIDASVYDLFKASEYAVSGALTVAKILEASSKAQEKGLDEDCVLLCSSKAYEALNADVSMLRAMDSSYKDVAEIGNRGIVIKAGFGKIRVIGHPMVMLGFSYLIPEKGLKKIGSTDITFGSPARPGEVVEHLESYHAYQVTGRFSFQVLVQEPAKCVLLTGIS